MPLLNVTGVNAIHENFNVAFGLSGREEEADFTWFLQKMELLRQDGEIAKPSVILSDYSTGFKKAARVVFAGVPQQLCQALMRLFTTVAGTHFLLTWWLTFFMMCHTQSCWGVHASK